MTDTIIDPKRRALLKITAITGAGLTLGFRVGDALAQTRPAANAAASNAATASFAPNAFVRIGSDNIVTVISKHLEMGQGTYTGLATLLADELDASWTQVRVEGAPADNDRYKNLAFGMQGTGGSTAIANSWEQMRNAGATARAMLVAAAAAQWKVAPESITVKDGVLSHASGKKATFGQLANAASTVSVPTQVKLKDPSDFTLIGKRAPRKDARAKSNGTAKFTQDVKLPNMLTAVVLHPPRFGARVRSFDETAVSSVPGVRYVVQVPNGVAVLATTFWAAKKGRDALKVQWDDESGFKYSSSEIFTEYRKLVQQPGSVAATKGDIGKAVTSGAKVIEAEYQFPYLAHAPMEPLNCVVKLGADSCEIWNGEQFQGIDQPAVAKALGMKPEQIKLNMLYAGGSFGRRANPDSDYILEAVEIAKELAKNGNRDIPVKLVWTREDDMRGGYYRPAFLHSLKAALDANGNVVGWQHRLIGQSIMTGTVMEPMMVKNGIDPVSVEGAANLPYAIPNMLVDLHSPKVAVPVLWWRSVGSTHTAYSTETFIDELAQAAGKDPVAFRRALLADHPRHLAVLDLVAKQSGWGSPLAQGGAGERRGRGVAVHESFNTVVAQVAEVTVRKDNSIKFDRVVCAVHCGTAVNPDNIRSQVEGGIGFGLSAALYGAITLKGGVVEQSNFNDYPVLRINEMPVVEVHIVPSTDKPTGVGEPATPVIAPALANAIAAATGTRLRNLPLKLA